MIEPIPGFLRIPIELRLQIYTIALDKRLGYHPDTYLSISAVSKQIRREVLGIFFQNSISFRSLNHLAKWTARGPPHLLPLVSNVSIHLFRDSLSPIADARRKFLPDPNSDSKSLSPMTAGFWEAEYARRAAPVVDDNNPSPSWMRSFLDCLRISGQKLDVRSNQNAISSAWKSFTAISEVRKIRLLFKETHYTSLPLRFDIEQQLLLDMMAAAFKNLQELTVLTSLLSLEYMRNFHDLRTLRFTGYSTSTPQETLEILRSLKNLDTVIVYRFPGHYDRDCSIITSELPIYLSLTPDVIESLNPLTTFQVQHITSAVPSSHITIPMMKALRAHINSLRALNLDSDAPLELDVINSIMEFTASSRLRDVNLGLVSRQPIESLDSSCFTSEFHLLEVVLLILRESEFAYVLRR
ncbi:hypothetical protein IFR05_016620 [Cadophora sp. M221]|nr:hypothetical protein IFR05_016620 [Cadophora sp. M221]